MSRFLLVVSCTVLLLATPLTIAACDVCGAFIGVTPYDNQSGFGIYHRYTLFSRINSIDGQPVLPAGAYRLQPQHSELHAAHDSVMMQKGDFESHKTVELRGKWFVHNRVEVNAQIPFVMTRMRQGGSLEKITGIGDVSCWVGIHILRRLETEVKQRLVVGMGVKLPTGKSNQVDAAGMRYHLYMQPGTGSVDETAYLQYSLGWKKWGLAFTATAKRNGVNASGEQVLPSMTSTANFFYMLRSGKTVLLPQVQLYAERCKGYTVSSVVQQGSAIGLLMGGIGCDSYFGNLGVHLTMQLPCAELKQDDTPAATFRGSLGVSWNINQQKFLFN